MEHSCSRLGEGLMMGNLRWGFLDRDTKLEISMHIAFLIYSSSTIAARILFVIVSKYTRMK